MVSDIRKQAVLAANNGKTSGTSSIVVMGANMHRFVPYFLLMVLLFPGCSRRKESALDESSAGLGRVEELSYIMSPPQPIMETEGFPLLLHGLGRQKS
jgi:hypothetical protein